MRSQQQQSAEIDAENMQHFVVRRPSPRVRTANATQTSMSLRIASSSPSLDVDQFDKCSSLGGHRGTPQLVGRAVTPLRHHQTSSGPVMGSSRQCRWLALALRGDGETQLELMHCGEPRFSAAALLGTALLVRSDAPKRKELESFIYQLPGPCLWLRSTLNPGYAIQISARAYLALLSRGTRHCRCQKPTGRFSRAQGLVPLTRRSASQPCRPLVGPWP